MRVERVARAAWRLARVTWKGVVRWTTDDDNYRARVKYDQLASRATWITYDMTPVAVDTTGTSLAV